MNNYWNNHNNFKENRKVQQKLKIWNDKLNQWERINIKDYNNNILDITTNTNNQDKETLEKINYEIIKSTNLTNITNTNNQDKETLEKLQNYEKELKEEIKNE